MQEPITLTILAKHLIFGAMAIIGGLIHALIAYRRGETRGIVDFTALALISGFAGVMWSLLALIYFPDNLYAIAFASGMGGFLSTEGLSMLTNYIKLRLK